MFHIGGTKKVTIETDNLFENVLFIDKSSKLLEIILRPTTSKIAFTHKLICEENNCI